MKNDPYIGPRPFERNDRDKFFGRAREARDLLALIMAERVVLFYAQSGAGKTSLLNTQIIPALEEEGFAVLPVVRVGGDLPPGMPDKMVKNIFVFSVWAGLMGKDTPLATVSGNNLVAAIKSHVGNLPLDENGESRPPILIVDQFEEILTTHRERWQDARGFFEQLAEALEKTPRLGVVLAMREDFVAGLDPYAPLLPKRLKARFRMERLGYVGALEAIQKPAASAGVPFAAGVAEQLVDDLRRIKAAQFGGAEETVLGPYVESVQLQVVCSQLWENLPEQKDQRIDAEDVHQYGDVDRALTGFYEHCVQLAVADVHVPERTLRHWFTDKLITPMRTRSLVLRGEKETAGLINEAVDHFESTHIISSDVRAGARWYEISHDRLVDPIRHSNRAWDQARQTPLRLTARQWKQTGQSGLLFVGSALHEAQAWIAAHPDDVEPEEAEFVAAGMQLEKSRKQRRVLTIAGFAVAALVIIVVSVLGFVAYQQSRIASSREYAALSDRLLYSDQEQAIILARLAIEQAHTTEAEISLRQSVLDYYPAQMLPEVPSAVYNVMVSPDGKQILAGLDDGEVRIWDAQSRQLLKTLPVGVNIPNSDVRGVWGMAYRSDGQQLALTTENQIQIWAADGSLITTLKAHTQPVYTVAYSPDGKWLASGSADKTIGLWNTATWQPITITGHSDVVRSVAFSPDGQYLASGSWDKTILLWPITSETSETLSLGTPLTLTGHTGNINAIAFSPDSKNLASASDDRTIRVWNVASGQEEKTLTGHTNAVRTLAYTADGQYLLSGSSDTLVLIWAIQRGDLQYIDYLNGPTSVVNGAAFSPDGRYVVGGAGDRSVWVWDRRPPENAPYVALFGHSSGIRRLFYRYDSKYLASASADGTVRIWDTATSRNVTTLPRLGTALWSAAYSPDGRLIATAGADGVTRIWDVSGSGPITVTQVLTGHANGTTVSSVAFSPDGKYLATGSWDKTAIIWDTATWQIKHRLTEHNDFVYAVAFSPDGRWLATGAGDRNIRLWDVGTGSLLRVLKGHDDNVYSLAFSPDGKRLASGSWDNTIRLWDLKTFTTTDVLAGHSSYVYDVAFSPDGKYLVSGSRDQSLRLWDLTVSPPQTIGILYGHTDLVRAVAYRPDGKEFASASQDTTIRRYPALFEDVLQLSKRYVPRDLTPDERKALLRE